MFTQLCGLANMISLSKEQFWFFCPRLVRLPIERMPPMKGRVLSDGVRPIIYESEVENYTRVDIMASYYSLTPSLS